MAPGLKCSCLLIALASPLAGQAPAAAPYRDAALTPEEAARVRLLVLEGVFTSVPEVLHYRFGRALGTLVETALSIFTRYDPHHTSTPLYVARRFKHTKMPVALITSEADTVVDPKMTDTISAALRAPDSFPGSGNTTHVLRLKTSPHSDYATDNVEDRAAYVAFMRDMYKQHV